jgi:hypothetical protein
MSVDKQKLGKAIPPGEKQLVNRISDAIHAIASGAETAMEDEAAARGASILFDAKEDGFISALAIVLVPKELKAKSRRIAAVAQPFGFVCKLSARERLAVITPAGYVTDFASIPKQVQFLISPFGKHAEAAVVHDWLYTLGKKGDAKSRRVADKAFVRALRLLEVNWLKRQIMYWAVRLGGAGGYGLPGDFAFRRIEDLSVLDPLPPRDPFMNTFATMALPKPGKARVKEAAVATETV